MEILKNYPSPEPFIMTKVVFIAIDAATWTVINPLLEQGKLPVIGSLMEEGVSAPLQSLSGYKSPALWMSIATGKMPEKTGITYFSNLFLDIPQWKIKKDLTNHASIDWPLRLGKLFSKDLKNPSKLTIKAKQAYIYSMLKYGKFLQKWKMGGNYLITSSFLKEKTIWDILSEEKMRCAVIGWLVTWPADSLYGILISQKVVEGQEQIVDAIDQYKNVGHDKLTYPENIIEEVRGMNKNPAHLTDDEINSFFSALTEEEKNQIKSAVFNRKNIFNFFSRLYVSDLFSIDAAVHLKAKINPEFLTVYLPGLDGLQHLFWRYQKPEQFPFLPKENLSKFSKTIESYYAFIDQQISKLIDADSTIIIASDHGMEAIPEPEYNRQTLRSGQHERSPDGVLIMKGKNIKKNIKLSNAHILDVIPTLLYLLGKELDDEMDGKVLTEALEEEFLQKNPILKKKYGKREPKEYSFYTAAEEHKVKERLKVLGYLD